MTLEDLGTIPANSWLMTRDVTLLYTNIDNVQGHHAAKDAVEDFSPDIDGNHNNKSLVQLMEFVLTKHNFQFNGMNYLGN